MLGVGSVPPPRETVLNVQVKNAGFYAFLLRNTTSGQKPEGGLLTNLGEEKEKKLTG